VSSQVSQGLSEGENALGGAAANLGGGAAGALGALGQGGGGLSALGAAGLGEVNTSAALGAAVPMGNLSAPPSAAPLLSTPVQLAGGETPLGPSGAAGMPMPPLMPPPISPGSGLRKRKEQKYENIAIGAELKGKAVKRRPSAGEARSPSATQSPEPGGLMCRESRPCWIPASTWLLRSEGLSGVPVAGLQLQLRVPNWLGSASAGVAVANVAASAIAAPTNNFSMIKDVLRGG